MKKATYFLTVLFAVTLMSTSCEKENSNQDNPIPKNNALRISKIADNPAMKDPLWTFEYNEKGLVTMIKGDRHRGVSTITYNDENLPVKIIWIENDIYFADTTITDISWDENSFTLSYVDWSDELEQETYTLDANGRIISIDWSDEDEYRRGYEASWEGDKAEIYYVRDSDEEWAQTRELTEYKHPLSAINIAIINAGETGEISWIYDECEEVFQNKYCLSYIASADEGSAAYEYEYNEDGYPTQLDIFETTDGGIYRFYFEYENDK